MAGVPKCLQTGVGEKPDSSPWIKDSALFSSPVRPLPGQGLSLPYLHVVRGRELFMSSGKKTLHPKASISTGELEVGAASRQPLPAARACVQPGLPPAGRRPSGTTHPPVGEDGSPRWSLPRPELDKERGTQRSAGTAAPSPWRRGAGGGGGVRLAAQDARVVQLQPARRSGDCRTLGGASAAPSASCVALGAAGCPRGAGAGVMPFLPLLAVQIPAPGGDRGYATLSPVRCLLPAPYEARGWDGGSQVPCGAWLQQP